jgi:transcription factor WhiB
VSSVDSAAAGSAVVHPAAMKVTDLYLYVADRGACTRLSRPDDMFPNPGEQAAVERARQVCAGCPVRAYCRELARRNDESHGVWGGWLLRPSECPDAGGGQLNEAWPVPGLSSAGTHLGGADRAAHPAIDSEAVRLTRRTRSTGRTKRGEVAS